MLTTLSWTFQGNPRANLIVQLNSHNDFVLVFNSNIWCDEIQVFNACLWPFEMTQGVKDKSDGVVGVSICYHYSKVIYDLSQFLYKIQVFTFWLTLIFTFQWHQADIWSYSWILHVWLPISGHWAHFLTQLITRYKPSKSDWHWIWPFKVTQY